MKTKGIFPATFLGTLLLITSMVLGGCSGGGGSSGDSPSTEPSPSHNPSLTEKIMINLQATVAPDTDTSSLTFSIVTAPTYGTVSPISEPSCTPSPSGDELSCTATVIYTPDAEYAGPDSFIYQVHDGASEISSATVDIVVASGDGTSEATDALVAME